MAYSQFTWSDLRDLLKSRVDRKVFWNDEEARLAFNEGLSTFNLLTGTWKRRETLLTIANQSDYVTSASMLYRTRLTFNNLPLASSSRDDLNNARPSWRSETTTSGGGVPTRPMAFAPISLQTFFLWPADAVGGNTLTIDGVAATPVLVEDGDTLDLSDSLLTILLGYGVHALAFKLGGPSFAATSGLWKQFLAAAAEENGQIKTSTVYRRVMGLDRRDLKPYRGAPTRIDNLAGGGGAAA